MNEIENFHNQFLDEVSSITEDNEDPKFYQEAFLDVFILRTNTYQNYDVNGEGNHLGFWNFQFNNEKIRFSYDKFFDDASGFEFKNGIDGNWNFDFYFTDPSFVRKIGINVLHTTDQSGNIHPPGIDSYYWHHVYTYGWRHNSFSYGNPLISPENNRKKNL